MKLTSAQAKKVVELYFACGKSPTCTARQFNTWAQHNNCDVVVTKKNVIDVMKRFEHRTTLQKDVRPRPSQAHDVTVQFDVLTSLYEQRGSSLRTCASETSLSLTMTQEVARHKLKLFPYRLLEKHALSEYNKIFRTEACRRLLELPLNEMDVVYTDEAVFQMDGHVNRWNARVWDYQRPDNFYAETWQCSKKVLVWAGMSRTQLYGPYFFPCSVTGDMYRAIISEMFVPDALTRTGSLAQMWFQQDGAPAHTAQDSKNLLHSIFETRVISRDFLREWPPRSPDLTPCDFYLWNALKELVYQGGHFHSLSDLQNAIQWAFNTIRLGKMNDVRNAVYSVPFRMQRCIDLCGCQLVHE
jgi:hypothetical protein